MIREPQQKLLMMTYHSEVRSVMVIVVALAIYDLGKLFLVALADATWQTILMIP
jgi:hypothetical protein